LNVTVILISPETFLITVSGHEEDDGSTAQTLSVNPEPTSSEPGATSESTSSGPQNQGVPSGILFTSPEKFLKRSREEEEGGIVQQKGFRAFPI